MSRSNEKQISRTGKSITSLVSVTSKDDDDDDDIPKSVLSLETIEPSSSSKAIRKSKHRERSPIKRSSSKKRRSTDERAKVEGKQMMTDTRTASPEKQKSPKKKVSTKKSSPIKKKDSTKEATKKQIKEQTKEQVKESINEQTKEHTEEPEKRIEKSKPVQVFKLEDPSVVASRRSSEPPPTVEDGSLMFTPSEISIYLDSDKDLFETTIVKKQQTTLLTHLRMPNLKLPLLKPKTDDEVKGIDTSINDLENLIFTTEGKTNELSPEEQAREKELQEQQDREIMARYENLIMDPAIFEAEYKKQEAAAESSQGTEAVATSDQGGQIVLPKEQFENPVVLFSYKAKKEHRKKKKKKKTEIRIGLIGAGKMSEAIVCTLIDTLKFNPNIIYVSSPSGRNLELFKAKGCQTTKRNIDIFTRFLCHIVFINIQGGVIRYCYKLGGIRPFPLTTRFVPVTRHRFFIFSLTTGVSLEEIKSCLFNPDQIGKYQFEMHRIMLNMCCIYGTSICGVDCELNKLSPIIKIFLEKFGDLEFIPEKEMDAACAIGGSGLAFAYYFLNAISDGSVRIGLSKEKSVRLVSQIAIATVDCLNRADDPENLFTYLTSNTPALVGLEMIRKQNMASHVEDAIKASYDRINELTNIEIAPAFSE